MVAVLSRYFQAKVVAANSAKVTGAAPVTDDGGDPVELGPGDLALIRGGPDHYAAHEPGARCVLPGEFRSLPDGGPALSAPRSSVFLCGAYRFTGDIGRGLVAAILVLPANRRRDRLLHRLRVRHRVPPPSRRAPAPLAAARATTGLLFATPATCTRSVTAFVRASIRTSSWLPVSAQTSLPEAVTREAVPSPHERGIARIKQRRDRLIAVRNLPARHGSVIHHALRIAGSPIRLPGPPLSMPDQTSTIVVAPMTAERARTAP